MVTRPAPSKEACDAEQPPTAETRQEPRSGHRAERQADEDRSEQHAVGRVCAAQVTDVDPGHPHERSTGSHGGGQAEEEARRQPAAWRMPVQEGPDHTRCGCRCRPTVAAAGRTRTAAMAANRNVAAVTYRARLTGLREERDAGPKRPSQQRDRGRRKRRQRADDIGPARPSRSASSRRSRGTRPGTVASLAATQVRRAISINRVAANNHHNLPTSGMDTTRAHRTASRRPSSSGDRVDPPPSH